MLGFAALDEAKIIEGVRRLARAADGRSAVDTG
jgi:hypothetical protein